MLAAALVAAVTIVALGLRSLSQRSQMIVTPGLFLFLPPIAALSYRAGRGVGLWTALLATVASWLYLLPPTDSWPAVEGTLPILALFAITAFGAAEGFARARESERRRRGVEFATAHLAAIVESSDDAIFSKSMDAVILSWNLGAERLYGYTPAEAVGRPVAMLAPPEHPNEIPTLMARLRKGETITRFDTVRVRKDGSRVDVALTISPIRDHTGCIIAASTIARDISSRLRLEQRQRLLVDVTAALSGAATPGQVAHAVVEHAAAGLGAPAAALWLTTREGTFELLASMGYVEGFADRWRRVAPGQDRHLDEAVRSGTVVWHDVAFESDGQPGVATRDGGRGVSPDGVREGAGAVVPLMLQTSVMGALSLHFAPPRRLDDDEVDFMLTLGRQCAQAFERARLYAHEHQTAVTLQRALLPAGMPDVPGMRLRAVYSPSTQDPGVGGDWYDVFRLPDGRVALSIGDVVGRGVEAAVVMGQVRQTVRAAALEGHPPAETLAIASQVIRLSHEHEGMTTAIFGIFDPATNVLAYATAGHPAPVLANKAGVRLLPCGGLPLGFLDGPAAPSWTAELPPGSLLVLHTDGLIEATRDPVGGQEALLRAVAREADEHSADAARAILARVVGEAAPDDIAIVTLAVDPQPLDRLDLVLPAQPSSLRLMRHALRQLSRGLGLDEETVSALMIASGEAVNNVIEHAYGASPGVVSLRATPSEGLLRVAVQDRGRWRPERAHNTGGRGLDLIRALADEVDVVTAPAGTTVTFAVSLPAKAAGAGAGPTEARSAEPSAPVVRRVGGGPRSGAASADWQHWRTRVVDDVPVVEIAGDVDLDNVGRFKTMIQDASAHARRGAVVLSLSQARYFDSQAFRALLQNGQRLTTMRCMLLLVLAPGAPLRPVLEAMDVTAVLPVFDSLPDAITAARVRES
ncbi:MAG TPA: SpoIIE family protein phosphatase [bacterium]|nr:SpoIIE family protein phosphatase [bacterium]